MASDVLSLDNRRFRSNPTLRAARSANPSEHQRVELGHGLCGVLEWQQPNRGPIAVDYDTALVFHALKLPGPIPEHLKQMRCEQRDPILARLVYDQVLQIQREDGSFVDGIAAHDELFGPANAVHEVSRHPIHVQSRAAIQYGAYIRHVHEGELARRLYSYNSSPCISSLEQLLPTRRATSRWLGLNSRAPWRRALTTEYQTESVAGTRDPWLRWRQRGAAPRGSLRQKIYVSPRVPDLPAAFEQVVRCCCEVGIPAFKIGADLPGVLRSDKLVLYFADEQTLRRAANELTRALTGIRAQGVPFTAPISQVGLLSCGVDPDNDTAPGFDGSCSWRMFIVDRIARTLISARAGELPENYQEAVLGRLRLDAIDPETWQPTTSWLQS